MQASDALAPLSAAGPKLMEIPPSLASEDFGAFGAGATLVSTDRPKAAASR